MNQPTEQAQTTPLTASQMRWLWMISSKPPFAKQYQALQETAQKHPSFYNQPHVTPPNERQLYEMAEQANLVNVAATMARTWGIEDDDGWMDKFDSLRHWPDTTRRGPHSLRLSLGKKHPKNFIMWVLPVDGHERIQVRDNFNRLVLCSYGKLMRPGDWMDTLMFEYQRFRIWRDENEETPGGIPKPDAPMPFLLSRNPGLKT